jgi:anti-sigma factor RsiW
MSETFRCDDKEMLVAYLYGEIDINGRREVERHLRTCAACTRETEALQDVRQDLASWIPPEPDLGFVIMQKPTTGLRPRRWSAIGTLPAWAQVAAAVLVLAAGAAIANVQVRYGNDGFSVRTGWMTPASLAAPATAGAPALTAREDAWRPELTALEQRLRQEFMQSHAAAVPATRTESTVDAESLMRRVQTLVNASEQRQREELGLRLAVAERDWDSRRRGDIVRIQQSIGSLQRGTYKVEAGQQEMYNVLRRVAQPIP